MDCSALSPAARRGCVSLSDVLGGPWREALLLNFQVDLEYLARVCPRIAERPTTVAHGWKDYEAVEALESAAAALGVRVVMPLRPEAAGWHHSKVAVLFHEHGVRVAVLSANLNQGNVDGLTQSAFVQDFPTKAATRAAEGSEFEDALVDYVARTSAALGAERLREFDFSGARALLVPSVPGWHAGEALHKYGHMRLRRLLSRGALPPAARGAQLAMQFSSLGAVDEDWFAGQLQRSLGGGAALVVFPTAAQVEASSRGLAGGLSLPAHAQHLKPFLVRRMRRWDARISGRERVLPHLKTYLRFYDGDGSDVRLDYVLTGSHNLSKAAWGQLQRQDSQLVIRSFEMSVLFLPELLADADPADPVFSVTPDHPQLGNRPEPAPCDYALGDTEWGVPLPYRLPPEPYRAGERPWCLSG